MSSPPKKLGLLKGVAILLVTFVTSSAVAYALLYWRQPLASITLHVRWAPDVDGNQRAQLEQQLHLDFGEAKGGTTWVYTLSNPTREAIRAIVRHPSVEDTADVDRQRFRPEPSQDSARSALIHSATFGGVATIALLGVFAWFSPAGRQRRSHWLGVARQSHRLYADGLLPLTRILVSIAIFAFGGSLYFLSATYFGDDHFVHLSAAQQMLFGDWPTRDFIDVGRPLTIVASAVAQRIIGHDLFSEAVLVSAAIGLAAALTAWTVAKATSSIGIGVGAALLQVGVFPRGYSYPKILSTALVICLIWRYIDRPTANRRLVLALGIATAFLFRHDLGLFTGVAGFVALLVADPTPHHRARMGNALMLAASTFALVSPYLIYVHLHGGLTNYFTTAMTANGVEGGYEWPNPLGWNATAGARLLYIFHAIPIIALGICAYDWKRGHAHTDTRFAVSISALALATNVFLMRAPLEGRVPDAIVPIVTIVGWLTFRALRSHALIGRVILVPALLGLSVLVYDLGRVGEMLNRTGIRAITLMTPSRLVVPFEMRSADLHQRFGSSPPSRVIPALIPFFSYLDRCTTVQDRLFIGGMIPEVAYYARRAFAGGAYEHYNYPSDTNQALVVSRLLEQQVPFALIPSKRASDLYEGLPIVARHIRSRYRPLTVIPISDDSTIQILIDSRAPWSSIDAATGWPCLVGIPRT